MEVGSKNLPEFPKKDIENLQETFHLLDQDHDGKLNFEDFQLWWKYSRRKSGLEKLVYHALLNVGVLNRKVIQRMGGLVDADYSPDISSHDIRLGVEEM